MEAIHSTFHRLEQRWLAPPTDSPDFFDYDPLPIALFLQGIRLAAEFAFGDRYLDIGCGIGTKLALMFHLGFKVTGIDHNQAYLQAAKELCPEATLILGDLFSVTSFDFDIIYFYRPARSDELQRKVDRHIISHASRASIVYAPERVFDISLPVEELGRFVWRIV